MIELLEESAKRGRHETKSADRVQRLWYNSFNSDLQEKRSKSSAGRMKPVLLQHKHIEGQEEISLFAGFAERLFFRGSLRRGQNRALIRLLILKRGEGLYV